MKLSQPTSNDNFSIVPKQLTASNLFHSGEFRVLVSILGTYQTKLENGEPWTYSIMSLSKATSLSDKTVSRIVTRLRQLRILNLYGRLKHDHSKGRTSYPIYTFDRSALDTMISTKDKVSVVKEVETSCETHIEPLTKDKLTDKVSDKTPSRSNIIKGSSVAVPKPETATASEIEVVNKDTSIPSGPEDRTDSMIVDISMTSSSEDRTANIINTKSLQPVRESGLLFEPDISRSVPLKVPDEVGVKPSARRQDYIVKTLNKEHKLEFIKENPMGSELLGYKICAYEAKKREFW